MRKVYYFLFLLSFSFIACESGSISPIQSEKAVETIAVKQGFGKVIPNSYLIQFKADLPELREFDAKIVARTERPQPVASQTAQMAPSKTLLMGQRLLQDHKVKNVKIKRSFSIPGAHTIEVEGTEEEIRQLLTDKRVSRIEPDQVVELEIEAQSKDRLIPSDIPVIYAQAKGRLVPSSSSGTDFDFRQVTPWGIKRVGGSTDMSGSSNVVYILDSGVDIDHPDLNVNKQLSKNFTTNRSNDFEDDFGHGTHVAGIIGAKDNTEGVVGVAAGIPIVAVKVLDQNGVGTLSNFLDGLDYILRNAVTGDIVNVSLGSTKSELLDQAVMDIRTNLGVTVVIAAGNQGELTTNYSPANITENGTYVIGSLGLFDLFSSFSNYGTNVKFVAPGQFIYSTWKNGGYGILSGTSMAAPHVSGLLMVTGGQLNNQEFQISLPSGNLARIAALP